jgi:hypothetical protein
MNKTEYDEYITMRKQVIRMTGELYTLADGYGTLLTREEWAIVREMSRLSIELMTKINRGLDE